MCRALGAGGRSTAADRELGTDELATPLALSGWLALQGLLPADAELDADDLERAIALREGMRALLAGTADELELGAELGRALAGAMLRANLGARAMLRFSPAAEGFDGALGRLLAIVAAAQLEGTWARFKVCGSDICRAAFYDFSQGRPKRWCWPRCGNLIASRSSRRRQREH